jgi:hypothetical protein
LNFRQLIAKYVTGNIPTELVPQIGIIGLEEGLDTPSLCILAGLDKSENFYVVESYLKLTLEELNIPIPNKRQAALEYACAITDEIINGEKEIVAGVAEIEKKAIDSYDFWSENKHYVYDSISFEKVYGLYVEYDDLLDAKVDWTEDKSNEELMLEIKEQMFDELIKWAEKTKLLLYT